MPESKITIFAQKQDGKDFQYENIDDIIAFKHQAPPGRYVVTIKRDRQPKSQKQCAVIFALMIKETIIQANDLAIGVDDLLVHLIDGRIPKGQMLTVDFLHELMYVICPTTDADGRRITLSKMNTLQASELFERYRNIMAPLGIVIDDPDPEWKKRISEVESTLRKG